MVRKETIGNMTGMTPATARTSADRDRAVDRVRRLTVGAGVAGVVAVGAFGGLAAMTYRGADATVTTAAVTTTTTGSTTQAASDDDAATDDDTTNATTTTRTTSGTTTPTVTTTTGSGHATTGGS